MWSERYDIIYAETGEYAKRITQRGANHRWGRRGYKKCSEITSNFHWSRQNGYRTCRKISYDDRFRQVLCVCVCVYSYMYIRARAFMYVCVCADSQYVQPQRATADGAFPTIFCAFCASVERLSALCAFFPVFTLPFDFFPRSRLEYVHYARAINSIVYILKILRRRDVSIYQTEREICFGGKKMTWKTRI